MIMTFLGPGECVESREMGDVDPNWLPLIWLVREHPPEEITSLTFAMRSHIHVPHVVTLTYRRTHWRWDPKYHAPERIAYVYESVDR